MEHQNSNDEREKFYNSLDIDNPVHQFIIKNALYYGYIPIPYLFLKKLYFLQNNENNKNLLNELKKLFRYENNNKRYVFYLDRNMLEIANISYSVIKEKENIKLDQFKQDYSKFLNVTLLSDGNIPVSVIELYYRFCKMFKYKKRDMKQYKIFKMFISNSFVKKVIYNNKLYVFVNDKIFNIIPRSKIKEVYEKKR
jgi:hypothetical protein